MEILRVSPASEFSHSLDPQQTLMVAELTADDIFGEMALIDSEPRSSTAVAITDVELVPITEKQFLFLVGQTPYFALKVMRTLAQRLRVTNKSFG